MGTEQTRSVVQDFFGRIEKGMFAEALSLLDESATWRLHGHAEDFPLAGIYKADQVPELFRTVLSAVPEGMSMSRKNMIADGGRAVVQGNPRGRTATGKTYDNQVVFIFEVRDRKIMSVEEYVDTLHLKDIVYGSAK